jgi:hypothetical protein
VKTIEELVLPTQTEIAERIAKRKEGDPFGFEVGEYVNYLDFEHAAPYLKEGVTAEEWDKHKIPLTKEGILETMQKYFSFAWEKANNCRGISANRSVMHYYAWIFLLGDYELLADVLATEYEFYGKPILEQIGNRYGWDWKALDNGKRTNTED